jgi:hypothetical protein
MWLKITAYMNFVKWEDCLEVGTKGMGKGERRGKRMGEYDRSTSNAGMNIKKKKPIKNCSKKGRGETIKSNRGLNSMVVNYKHV